MLFPMLWNAADNDVGVGPACSASDYNNCNGAALVGPVRRHVARRRSAGLVNGGWRHADLYILISRNPLFDGRWWPKAHRRVIWTCRARRRSERAGSHSAIVAKERFILGDNEPYHELTKPSGNIFSGENTLYQHG
jgi:hypothetical protein